MDTDWEERYLKNDTPWDKGEPSPGLLEFFRTHPDLKHGTVCVPGCGMGHDALAWAEQGFEVTGIDISPTAVDRCRSVRRHRNLRFECRDFLNETPEKPFDWLFEHTLYCAINPSHRDRYAKSVIRWVKPGGHFLAVHYLIDDEDGPPFGCTREEIIERFSPMVNLVEDWEPVSWPHRQGLERMFLWRVPEKG